MRIACQLILSLLLVSSALADGLESSLKRSGENRPELERALKEVPETQRDGMEFLIEHMPQRDLVTLKADFLIRNVRLAYKAWDSANWKDQIPKDVFLNDVLPYASITETRDDWRGEFYAQFSELVKDAKTPGEAATILNNNIFKILNVKYSTKRERPDQSPSESIEQGVASCSGLSVVLIDACRAVGVPARFVGTPLWSNKSGNHSWVEVYDRGSWHFTGACEATGDDLNEGWFVEQASKADRNNPIHAIYATSYRKTPTCFPMLWNLKATYVNAVNVTDRYTQLKEELPEGVARVSFVAKNGDSDERIGMSLVVLDSNRKEVFRGKTNDESFDRNDHVSVPLTVGNEYELTFDNQPPMKITAEANSQLIVYRVRQKQEYPDQP